MSRSLALVLYVGLSSAAQAADLYVATAGDDANDCMTRVTACATLGRALDVAAAAGDTIHVAAGTYVENVGVDKAITIQGDAASTTDSGPPDRIIAFRRLSSSRCSKS